MYFLIRGDVHAKAWMFPFFIHLFFYVAYIIAINRSQVHNKNIFKHFSSQASAATLA